MNESTFLSLIDTDQYQVLFLASRMSVPFVFALHTWVVIVDHGEASRYDVWGDPGRCKTSWGHLHCDLYKPWLGVRIFPSEKSDPQAPRFRSFLLYELEGREGSLAERIVQFIRSKSKEYPYINDYHYFPGPNSNRFTQWIIDQFPELSFRLPWAAIGKKHRR
jgi:hypothetical protein